MTMLLDTQRVLHHRMSDYTSNIFRMINSTLFSQQSRPSKKVHNFGKRSNSIKRNPNAPVIKSNWLYKQVRVVHLVSFTHTHSDTLLQRCASSKIRHQRKVISVGLPFVFSVWRKMCTPGFSVLNRLSPSSISPMFLLSFCLYFLEKSSLHFNCVFP